MPGVDSANFAPLLAGADTPSPATVLLVDDESASRNAVRRALRLSPVHILEASDGRQALETLAAQPVDLVLLDIRMPQMDGYAFLEHVRQEQAADPVPVWVLSAWDGAIEQRRAYALGADDFLPKTIDNVQLKVRIDTLLRQQEQRRRCAAISAELLAIAEELSWQMNPLPMALMKAWEDMALSHMEYVMLLADAARLKKAVSLSHARRVSRYSALLAHNAGWPDEEAKLLSKAALLHDIGALAIPDEILHKPQGLSAKELVLAKHYPRIGAAILGKSDSRLLRMAREIAIAHREHYDGSGFPSGLVGRNIPIAGRIVAVADAFDAILTNISPPGLWSPGEIIGRMFTLAETQLDLQLVELFLQDWEALIRIWRCHPGEDDYTPLCCRFFLE